MPNIIQIILITSILVNNLISVFNITSYVDQENLPVIQKELKRSEIISDDILIIKAKWNGKAVSVFIDLGATSGAISSELAATLTALPGKKVQVAGATGTWRESNLYMMEGLAIGDLVIKPFEAHEKPASKQTRYDIVIGLEQLKNYVIEIDLQQSNFTLFTSNPYPDIEMRELGQQTEEEGSSLLVSAKIGQYNAQRMILDTGAGINMIEPDRLKRFRYRKAGNIDSIDATGVVERSPTIVVKEVCVDKVCSKNQVFLVSKLYLDANSLPIDGIIGMPFLQSKKILIDLIGMRYKIFAETGLKTSTASN